MSNVVEEIPAELAPAVEAALTWLGDRDERTYGVSGVVDPEATIAQQAGGERSLDLRLIVCSGDLCLREDVRIESTEGRFRVVDAGGDEDPPAELDPVPGARAGWLDAALAQHAFVVLLFYRGFW